MSAFGSSKPLFPRELNEYQKLVKKAKRTQLEDALYAEIRLHGLPLPIREYEFHPTRKWRMDFCWPDRKIMVEIHGGIFMRKRTGHSTGKALEEDFEKENEATKLGWSVYKFGPQQVRRKKQARQSSAALEFLYELLKGEPCKS